MDVCAQVCVFGGGGWIDNVVCTVCGGKGLF